jgi:hypothetical protein
MVSCAHAGCEKRLGGRYGRASVDATAEGRKLENCGYNPGIDDVDLGYLVVLATNSFSESMREATTSGSTSRSSSANTCFVADDRSKLEDEVAHATNVTVLRVKCPRYRLLRGEPARLPPALVRARPAELRRCPRPSAPKRRPNGNLAHSPASGEPLVVTGAGANHFGAVVGTKGPKLGQFKTADSLFWYPASMATSSMSSTISRARPWHRAGVFFPCT